jgi:hypothetical protein
VTCAEFAALTVRRPQDVTRAERVATLAHFRGCDACRKKLTGEYEEAMKVLKLTPLQKAVLVDAVVGPMAADDLADPEARATLYPKPPQE